MGSYATNQHKYLTMIHTLIPTKITESTKELNLGNYSPFN